VGGDGDGARLAGRTWLAVLAGGMAGGLLRGVLAETLPAAGGVPWATAAANLTGTAVLGVVAVRLGAASAARRLLGTGFCGALTTFAALQVEAVGLVRGGRPVTAVAYVGASLAGGLLVAAAAMRAARPRDGR
jgi:CrcB protein